MLFSVAACGSKAPEAEAPAETPQQQEEQPAPEGDIVIGVLQDITGVTSTLGKMVQEGAQWAADEINAAGGVNGRKIKLVTYDTKADVQEAINAFNRMANRQSVSCYWTS